MRVKAMRCHAFGPPENLVFEDIDLPAPGPGEALVRTERIGVNFPDGLIVEGGYQLKPPLPFTPGTEVSGEIFEARPAKGDSLPRFARPGDPVMAGMRTGAYAEGVEESVGPRLAVWIEEIANGAVEYGRSSIQRDAKKRQYSEGPRKGRQDDNGDRGDRRDFGAHNGEQNTHKVGDVSTNKLARCAAGKDESQGNAKCLDSSALF